MTLAQIQARFPGWTIIANARVHHGYVWACEAMQQVQVHPDLYAELRAEGVKWD